jgi:hypothetical protein
MKNVIKSYPLRKAILYLRAGKMVQKKASLQPTGSARTAKKSARSKILISSLFKGTVQRDRFGWKWYQSIDLSLNVRRRDFQLILTAYSRVRGPLSFRATSYEYLQLLRQFPIMVQTFCSALFLTPFCHSQLR